jgi:hypothetical protein
MPAALLIMTPPRERRDGATRQALLRRVYGEFQEMPCLRLTGPQARRLFGLRSDVCQRVLASLVRDEKLVCDGERYRLSDRAISQPPSIPSPHKVGARAS